MQRQRTIFLAIMIFFSVIAFRAFQLQVVGDTKVESLIKKQFARANAKHKRRGDILDRNGVVLAFSSPSISIYVDPKKVKNRTAASKKLSSVFGKSWKYYYYKIKKAQKRKSRFLWVKRKQPLKIKAKLKGSQKLGIFTKDEFKRFYPYGTLAKSIIGSTNIDERGITGIEKTHDHLLAYIPKKAKAPRDGKGRSLTQSDSHQSIGGESVSLNIDREIQHYAEVLLQEALQKHRAKRGLAAVMDAKTGSLIAMADIQNGSNQPKRRFGHAVVTDSFEPGSVFKALTLLAASEENLINQDSLFTGDGGKIKIGKHTVSEADEDHALDVMGVSDILAKSSNVGATKVSFLLGADRLFHWIKAFGFGNKTGIDFPGESKGILPKSLERKIVLSNVGFGQGISTTPLQLLSFYAAIANHGLIPKPKLLKEKYSESDESKRPVIISEKSRSLIERALVAVTSEGGGGLNSKVSGFQIAGKTGTSQVVHEGKRGYVRGKYIASFIGYPTDVDRRFVTYVAIFEPKWPYYGNQVAAPVFSKLTSEILRLGGISSNGNRIIPLPLKSTPKESDLMAQSKPSKKPTAPVDPPKQISLAKKKSLHMELAQGLMPDLKGLTLRQAVRGLNHKNFQLKTYGSGIITKQAPKPGTKLSKNSKIKVWLSPNQ